jgi:hypothetical protein
MNLPSVLGRKYQLWLEWGASPTFSELLSELVANIVKTEVIAVPEVKSRIHTRRKGALLSIATAQKGHVERT